MTVYGAVFARGGSKGVPGKNLRKVGGVSLLQLAVDAAKNVAEIDRVFCSTDSAEIAREARNLGAEVPFLRPDHLAQDNAPEWAAWQHLADHLLGEGASQTDLLVSVPTTSPLRANSDIAGALELFGTAEFDVVIAVSESERSPWFNIVTRDSSGAVSLAAQAPGGPISRRQDAPETFDITTVVYITTFGFITSASGLFEGTVGSVIVPRERAIDIDTEFDLELADYLFRRKLGR